MIKNPYSWAFLSALFAAITAVTAKVGLEGIDSDFATLIRTGIILPLLAIFVFATGKWMAPTLLPSRSLLFLAISGLATGASWLCYFRALQLGDASKIAPIDKGSIILVAIFAVAFLGERPSPREWIGIGLAAAGIIVLATARKYPPGRASHSSRNVATISSNFWSHRSNDSGVALQVITHARFVPSTKYTRL